VIVLRMPDPGSDDLLDAQLKTLRSSISDLGHQVDSRKTATAAALGGGVFLLLLAVGGAYDLMAHRDGSWLMLGVTREALIWIAGTLGVGAIVLLALGLVRVRMRDSCTDARLEKMEQKYEELLEQTDALRETGLD
jgi:hypothetical protein